MIKNSNNIVRQKMKIRSQPRLALQTCVHYSREWDNCKPTVMNLTFIISNIIHHCGDTFLSAHMYFP